MSCRGLPAPAKAGVPGIQPTTSTGARNQRHSFNVAPPNRLTPEEVMPMSRESSGREGRSLRGFARMEPNKQRELARKGGANVPSEKRSFSQDRMLASEAGRKGGRRVSPQSRSFSKNRALAAEAGRKGGRMSQKRREVPRNDYGGGIDHRE